jgi:hypothetical protein
MAPGLQIAGYAFEFHAFFWKSGHLASFSDGCTPASV